MANETKWFFARNGQQSGPVTISELKEMIGRGEVGPGDLVWHEGMDAWKPAGEVPELGAKSAAAIGYYAPSMGMPERARINLRSHAHPTGDIGDWPLDDQRLDQFHGALRLRKKITGAASLYRTLMGLSAISFVVLLLIAAFTLQPRPAGQRNFFVVATLPSVALLLGCCVLYFFAERATRRSQRWAPLTMFIVFVISGAAQAFSIVMAASANSAAQAAPAMMGLAVLLVFAAAFAIVSWKALAAIPGYLAQPAWCQELIVKAGL